MKKILGWLVGVLLGIFIGVQARAPVPDMVTGYDAQTWVEHPKYGHYLSVVMDDGTYVFPDNYVQTKERPIQLTKPKGQPIPIDKYFNWRMNYFVMPEPYKDLRVYRDNTNQKNIDSIIPRGYRMRV